MLETGKYSDPIRIRAHHLLCMQGFQGYGYTPDFERHMEGIIAILESEPSYKVQIVVVADEICSHCPHETDGLCDIDSDPPSGIGKLDVRVIQKAALNENSIYTVENALKLVNNNLNCQDIIEICSKCRWKDKCLFFIKKTEY